MSGASGTFPVGIVLCNQAVEHNLVTFSELSCMLVGKDNQRPVHSYMETKPTQIHGYKGSAHACTVFLTSENALEYPAVTLH